MFMVKKKLRWINILLVVLIILGIMFVLYLNETKKSTKTFVSESTGLEKSDYVVAVADGETIFNSDIDKILSLFPADKVNKVNRDFVINQTINNILMKKLVDDFNITVSDSEYNKSLNDFLKSNSANYSMFLDTLQENNLTEEMFRDQFISEIKYNKLLDNYIFNNLTVTDDEAKEFYENNSNLFINQSFYDVKDILKNNLIQIKKMSVFSKFMDEQQKKIDIVRFKNKDACSFNKPVLYSDVNIEDNTKGTIYVRNTTKNLVNFCLGDLKEDLPVLICKENIYSVNRTSFSDTLLKCNE